MSIRFLPQRRRAFLGSALLAVCLAAPGIAAALLKTDPAKSAVTITFKQMNVPIDAKFNQFDARIDFNSAKPELSKASVDINVNSFDLGDPEYNKEVLKKEWFNAAQFPKASFVSSTITPAAPGKFTVTGKLTIKGKTTDVTFPLSVKAAGKTQVFEGALPIKRLTYNIGEGEWKDTSMVADEIIIKFQIVTLP